MENQQSSQYNLLKSPCCFKQRITGKYSNSRPIFFGFWHLDGKYANCILRGYYILY